MTNRELVRAWAEGRVNMNGGNLSVDGEGSLWSYDLEIGRRQGQKLIVYDYRAPMTVSHTTTCHVGLAVTAAVLAHEAHGISYAVEHPSFDEVALARAYFVGGGRG